MKIISRNVNGIRAVMKKGLLDFLQKESPDVFCIQETKAFAHQMPPAIRTLPYPNICRHAGQRPGYAGTAILSKPERHNHANLFEHTEKFHEDGRVTEVEYDDFTLLNIYFPNGNPRSDGTEMLGYKLSFYDELADYIQQYRNNGKKVMIVGDFNICHTRIDIARPDANKNSIGFLPEEREKMTRFMQECGLTDVFRHFNPELTDEYTWWSYRAAARERNVGRRLDYCMVTDDLLDQVKTFKHRQDVFGSDHCPVEIEIDTK